MDIQNLSDSPITFTLSGKEYLVRRQSFTEYFSVFQSIVKSEYFSDINKMAELIKDYNERLEFQVKSMKGVPKGDELDNIAMDKISTIDGGIKIIEMALKKDNKITEEELKNILTDPKNVNTMRSIILFVRGVDIQEDKKEGLNEVKTDTEKKS